MDAPGVANFGQKGNITKQIVRYEYLRYFKNKLVSKIKVISRTRAKSAVLSTEIAERCG